MKPVTLAVVFVAAGAALSSALMAAQQAPPANLPGMQSLARMVVINGREEAIPVVLQPGGEVQPVAIVGTPAVALAGDAVVWSRTSRQGWEYRTMPVGGDDLASVLNTAGVDGWEAVGVTGSGAAARVLLKRPR